MVKYELCCRFVHCRGEIIRSAGYVDTEEEARAWLKDKQGLGVKLVRDVAPNCRVAFCPMRLQPPVYFYRNIEVPAEPKDC